MFYKLPRWFDLLSKCGPPQANERRERYVGAASADVLNMLECVGKKQLRLPARSLRSFGSGGLHFEIRSDQT